MGAVSGSCVQRRALEQGMVALGQQGMKLCMVLGRVMLLSWQCVQGSDPSSHVCCEREALEVAGAGVQVGVLPRPSGPVPR